LAVGIVIGVAFGKIVDSLVNDLMMPPIGKLLGGVDFTNLFVVLGSGEFASLKAAKDAGAATLNYGVFSITIVNFTIVAFALFMVMKGMNAMRKEAPPAPTTRACPQCQMDSPIKAVKCGHCTSSV
jgi:large conductance mechanosensitive channel